MGLDLQAMLRNGAATTQTADKMLQLFETNSRALIIAAIAITWFKSNNAALLYKFMNTCAYVQDRAENAGSPTGVRQDNRASCSSAGAHLFPFMLQQRCPDLFSYAASNFRVHRSKAGTARVVCWQELGIANR